MSPPNNTCPHIHFFHLAPLFSTNEQQKEIIDESNIDDPIDEDDDGVIAETIYGVDDDRTQSFDPKIGHFDSKCTAWLISDDVFVTAGNCVGCGKAEADEGDCTRWEELSPVPTDFTGHVVEFNVLDSESTGKIARSA